MTAPKRSMTAAELLATIEVEHLTLEPGDILVFKSPQMMTAEEFTAISDHVRAVLPDTKVLIVEGDADLAVLRAET